MCIFSLPLALAYTLLTEYDIITRMHAFIYLTFIRVAIFIRDYYSRNWAPSPRSLISLSLLLPLTTLCNYQLHTSESR